MSVLLTGGFFRSLQFTSLNGMAFADVDHAQMSRASTMSTMGQQLAQSIGIGLAATFLHMSMVAHHAQPPDGRRSSPRRSSPSAVVALISVLFFMPLPANAGAELHGAPAKPNRRDRFFRHA